MRHPRHSSVAATAALLAALAIAGPASATGINYKVQIGTLSTAAGPQPFTAASSGSVSFAGLACASSSVPSQPSNTIANNPTSNVLDLASIAAITFSGCTRSGIAMTVTQNSTWKLHGLSGATTAATDVVSVHLDSINATVASSVCQYKATGVANAAYRESTKTLTLNQPASGNLVASNVQGCGGQVVNGQALSWTGSYTVNVANNSIINIKP